MTQMFQPLLRAPLDLLYGVPVEEAETSGSYEQYADRKIELMREAYATVREHLRANAHRMTNRYNLRVRPKIFEVGTWVYYYSPRRYKGRSPKWERMFTGPYLITHCIGQVT